jgi:hypothetical protein
MLWQTANPSAYFWSILPVDFFLQMDKRMDSLAMLIQLQLDSQSAYVIRSAMTEGLSLVHSTMDASNALTRRDIVLILNKKALSSTLPMRQMSLDWRK